MWMNQPIETVSELAHIEGSNLSYIFYSLCENSWLSLIFFLVSMHLKDDDFRFDFVDGMMCVGLTAGLFAGGFKMNYFNKYQRIAHTLPLFIAVLLIPVAYAVQQFYIPTATWYKGAIVVILGPSSFLLFLKVCRDNKALAEKNQDITVDEIDSIKDEINMASLKGVGTETFAIMIPMVVVGLWIIDYDQNCEYGCRGPVSH